MLGKKSVADILIIFFFFLPENRVLMQIVQALLSEENNKENIINFTSADNDQRVLKVNEVEITYFLLDRITFC